MFAARSHPDSMLSKISQGFQTVRNQVFTAETQSSQRVGRFEAEAFLFGGLLPPNKNSPLGDLRASSESASGW
jgi:hypothetical protein